MAIGYGFARFRNLLRDGRAQDGAERAVVAFRIHPAEAVATRFNPAIKAFYFRLLAGGKPKKLALVAAMRKLLSILNTLIKKDELWIDDRRSAASLNPTA